MWGYVFSCACGSALSILRLECLRVHHYKEAARVFVFFQFFRDRPSANTLYETTRLTQARGLVGIDTDAPNHKILNVAGRAFLHMCDTFQIQGVH